MSIPLEKLLEQIPSDTEEIVRRARDRFDQQIREALRQESALRLRRDEADDGLGPRKREALAVRVSLMPGLPAALRSKAIDEKDWLAAALALAVHSRTTARFVDGHSAPGNRSFGRSAWGVGGQGP